MRGLDRKNGDTNALLRAMRAHDIPMGEHGLWRIVFEPHAKSLTFGSGFAVALYRTTEATLHLGHGDLVMIDHIVELQKHLQFVLHATGRVLVTGLGLGCVVRGLLHRNRVHEIVVIERDPSVIRLVWPSLAHESRLSLVQAEALGWARTTMERFDYAWHDLWIDTDHEDIHLQVRHGEVMTALASRVIHQGAWAFPRLFKRGPLRWPDLVG